MSASLEPLPFAPRCLSRDLEVGRGDGRIHRFAAGASILLGHNLTSFDRTHLQAINPDLPLLSLPDVDTLRLNPLAFPRNPYHHLVKDYQDRQLKHSQLNDPELDARLARSLRRPAVAAAQVEEGVVSGRVLGDGRGQLRLPPAPSLSRAYHHRLQCLWVRQSDYEVSNSRLGRQLSEATAALQAADIEFALIGGLALAPHNVVRATQDVDLLVDLDQADVIESTLLALGYRCLHRSEDAANYQRGDERLDLLYAHRRIARRLLADAATLNTPFGALRAVSAEGLIGLKLQALVNDPGRTQERHSLMSCCENSADDVPFVADGGLKPSPPPAGDPFEALDDLMVVVEALCPTWPPRPIFRDSGHFRL